MACERVPGSGSANSSIASRTAKRSPRNRKPSSFSGTPVSGVIVGALETRGICFKAGLLYAAAEGEPGGVAALSARQCTINEFLAHTCAAVLMRDDDLARR